MYNKYGVKPDLWSYILLPSSIILMVVFYATSSFAQYSTSDFAYYKNITLNADDAASGTDILVDFPVLISIDADNDLICGWAGNVSNINGYDIMFFDISGNQLDHELEYYQSYDGKYVAWVRIPSFDPTTTTTIRMYYGNSAITTDPSVSTVWAADYEIVLHLEDNNLEESTNNFSSISQNGTWLVYNELFGRCRGFSGYNNYIQVPIGSINDNGPFTISLWFKPTERKSRTLFDGGNPNNTPKDFYSFFKNNKITWTYQDSNNDEYSIFGNSHITKDAWSYLSITGSYNGTVQNIFLNGSQIATAFISSGGKPSSLLDLRFGSSNDRSSSNTNNDFIGNMDEIRISSSARTSDWIATEYANQNSPNTFVAFGTEQANDATPLTVDNVIIIPVDCNGGINGSATLTLSGGTEPYQVTWSNGQTGQSLINVTAGEYTATIIDNNGSGTTIYEYVTITEPDALEFTIINVSEELCYGVCDGQISYSITGGVMPYTRSWETEPIASQTPLREITFTGNEYLEDYQISFPITYDADMQADFSDLRFYASNGDALSYWIEEFTSSISAKVWVKIPVINTGSNSISMTYGDSSLSNIGSIESTMINGGLQAAYYYLGYGTSSPAINPADLVAICIDNGTAADARPIDHNWSNGAIDLCGQSYSDYTLISWTGWLKKPDAATGDNFSLQGGSDDGFRLMLDGTDITNPTIAFWGLRSYGTTTGDYTFTKDVVSLRFDFWENSGFARTTFSWDYPGGSGNYEFVPASNYYCTAYSDNPPTDIVIGDEIASTLFFSNGLCAGTNTYIVTDANGCTQSQEVTITSDNTAPQISCVENFETTLLNDYTYTISGSTHDATATDNCTVSTLVHNYDGGGTTLDGKTFNYGTTTVTWTATDSNGNTSQCTQDITINPPLTVTGTITPVSCYGDSDGQITLNIMGGTPPSIILWSNGSTEATINNLASGTYTATVTDANGNGVSVSKEFTVKEPPALVFTITPVTQYLCDETCSGSFEYQVSGGTTPYSLSWIPSTPPVFKKQQLVSFTGYENISDYQLKITIPYQSGMQSNFDDIRFEDESGNTLPYWIESYSAMEEATVWVKIDQIEIGENTISLIYGDETATCESNLFNTMNSGGLRAKYYYMPELSNAPTINESDLISECVDNGTSNQHRPIDHHWGWQDGALDICDQTYTNNVIISWRGWLKKPDDAMGDAFSLRIGSDDGSRVMLGDATRTNPTVEYWNNRSYKTTIGSYSFTADFVPIVFDYYENSGNARVTFEWQYPGESTWEIVPQEYFYYAQYSATPPDNITFGLVTAYDTNLQENLCAGTEIYTITDASGCTAFQTYTVMNDEEPPVITLPPSATINLSNTCQFQISGTEYNATATDNCTLISLVHDYDGGGTSLAGKELPSGTTIILWTATDNSGNTTTAYQQIVVNTPSTLSISGAITNVQCPGNTDGAIDITVEDRGILQVSETEGGVAVANDPKLNLTTEGTLEAWIYPYSIGKYSGIIQKGTNMNTESYSLQFFNSQLCLSVCYSYNNYEYITTSETIDLNSWHHVAGVWDSDSLYLFLDGVKVSKGPINGHPARISSGIIKLGYQYAYSGNIMDLDGKLRDARIWNTAHSEAQIAQYRYEQPQTGNGLVASWPLDEGTGINISDISGNNLHGTINEGLWTTPSYTYLWSNGATTEDISGIPDGTYTVTVTNEFGCSVEASYTVSVLDTEPPNIILAATPVSVTANSGNGYTITDAGWDATATDNCALTSFMHDFSGGGNSLNGSFLPIGTHTITWTAFDNSGNISSESFDITVEGAFAPGGVAHDLEVWLRADKQVNTDIDGTAAAHNSSVAQWVGFNTIYSGIQSSFAAQPTFKTAEASQINYNGYLNFDGLDDNLILNHTGIGMESSNTIFVVCKPDGEAPLLQIGSNTILLCSSRVEYRINNTAANSTLSSANTIPAGVWSLLSVVKTGDEIGDIRIFRQGEELDYQKRGSATIVTGSNMTIGSDSNDNYLNGSIAEIIIYNTALSETDRKKVESYLAVKYGITL